MSVFEPFPKLARLSRECVVTEKIDGTNAQVLIDPVAHQGAYEAEHGVPLLYTYSGDQFVAVWAGSRTRTIRPGKTSDNYGFAEWVFQHGCELAELGVGRHFGEWWGKGIQRGYGLTEKRFSLFHTAGIQSLPACVSVVPTLYEGVFDTARIEAVLTTLGALGSVAAPGFDKPEGIVVYHTHAKVAFKKTFDDRHKEAA